MRSAPLLFPSWRVVGFNHHFDEARGGVEGLAARALDFLEQQDLHNTPVFVCGESFGGTVALTMAHLRPERIAGLILFSTFRWHPSTLARRGAGALAVCSFLGRRASPGAYRAGRLG